jgi:hypothetical protein
MQRSCECTVKITDPERRKRFEGIFKNDKIPIKYPLPAGKGRIGKEIFQFYELDKSRLSEEQKLTIIKRIASAFYLSFEEVYHDFNDPSFKVPIKVDSCVVSWCPLH